MLKVGKKLAKVLGYENGESELEVYFNNDIIEDLLQHFYEETRERFYDEIDEAFSYWLDSEVVWTSDFWEHIQEYATPLEVLNGEYTMDNFYSDMYENFMDDFDNIVYGIYDYVDRDDMQDFINELEEDLED